jgi:hypothetical protein
MPQILKKLWNDPVFSKVLAAVIVAGGIAAWHLGRGRFALILLLTAGLLFLASLLSRKSRLRAGIDLEDDKRLDQVPWVKLHVANPGLRSVAIRTVEFVTKENWDMPDPFREGVTTPVGTLVPAGDSLIKISTEKGSAARGTIGKTLKPRDSLDVSFRLITDYAPHYGFGLFPFCLEVTLLYGKSERLPLPNIVVSLHGNFLLSELRMPYDPIMLLAFNLKPGDIRSRANAVLSKIAEGAKCPPRVRDYLEQASRLKY